MVMIIGGIAESERERICARPGDGIRRVKAAGVHKGRPPKPTKHQQRETSTAALGCGNCSTTPNNLWLGTNLYSDLS